MTTQRAFASEMVTALRVTVVLLGVAGVGFPAVLYALGQLAFSRQAETSLVRDRCGRIVGSALVGQQFVSAYTFHGRPSASRYDGMASGGSNLGPTHAALADSLDVRATRFRGENGLRSDERVPPDAITSSGSGLDPDVTLATAELQVGRVARATGFDSLKLLTLIRERAWPTQDDGRDGRVNVLALNIALDSAAPRSACGMARK